jgi:hypothetical protein
MNPPKPTELSRRRLFAGAGTAGALAAAAVALPLARPTEPAVAAVKPEPDKGGGYQLTQHVLDYYQTARV